jgi:Protein of unknown function (DUF3102)
MSVVPLFDYARLGPAATEFKVAAAAIRQIGAAHAIEIGRMLIALKEKAPHGAFSAWVTSELQMQMRTAQNMMGAARFIEGKNETVSHLPATVLYKLSAPSADQTIVADVLAASEAGRLIDPTEVYGRLVVASDARREATSLFRRSGTKRQQKLSEQYVEQRLTEQKAFVEREARLQAELRPIAGQIARSLPDEMKARLRSRRNHDLRRNLIEFLLDEIEVQGGATSDANTDRSAADTVKQAWRCASHEQREEIAAWVDTIRGVQW